MKYFVEAYRNTLATSQKHASNSAEGYVSVKVNHVLRLSNRELNQIFQGASMTETMWRCDQLRAGQLYNRMMFDTKAEADNFAQRMRQMEPDQTFAVEAIQASQVWN